MAKKKNKISKNKKSKPSKSKNKNIEKDNTSQAKYHDLNMKVLDSLRTQGINSENINFINTPTEIKMSAVILKLAEPYIRMYWGNEIRIRTIISLTVCTWNMAFLPSEEQVELQEKYIEEIFPKDSDAQDVSIMLRVFENLLERKKKLFPGIRTFIMGHDLRLDSKNIHLDISSAPLDKKD